MQNISPKEWVISIIVALLALAAGILIEPAIKDGMLNEIKTYQQALQVNNDPTMFQYAQRTGVGNVLAYGEFSADQPATIPELTQSYAMILRVDQHYTMHTRTVCSGSGKNQHCSTQIYYEWDRVGSQGWASASFSFLGVVFQLAQIDVQPIYRLELSDKTMSAAMAGRYTDSYLYEQGGIFGPSGDDRSYYEILPINFAGTVFVRFLNDQITNPTNKNTQFHVSIDQTPAQVIQGKKDGLIVFDIIYYTVWLIVVVGIYLIWAFNYAEIE